MNTSIYIAPIRRSPQRRQHVLPRWKVRVCPTGNNLYFAEMETVARSFAEMETNREKSATPTRDYVVASSSAAAAVADDGKHRMNSTVCHKNT